MHLSLCGSDGFGLLDSFSPSFEHREESLHQLFDSVIPNTLILFYKVTNQSEYRLITIEANGLICIVNGVVIWESSALLILEEDAGHVTLGEGIVIAVGDQFTTIQRLEIQLLAVCLL